MGDFVKSLSGVHVGHRHIKWYIDENGIYVNEGAVISQGACMIKMKGTYSVASRG